jgi:hypothetical protein
MAIFYFIYLSFLIIFQKLFIFYFVFKKIIPKARRTANTGPFGTKTASVSLSRTYDLHCLLEVKLS